MNFTIYKEIILPSLTVGFSILGGMFAMYVYYQNSKLKRAEWLYSLFDKFFYDSKYSTIRRIIDYADIKEIKKLIDGINSKDNHDLEEQLVNYLNFFEFIANLWILKQVPLVEIEMMFEYYIKRIKDHDFIMIYIKKNGFEGVAKLVEKVTYEKLIK